MPTGNERITRTGATVGLALVLLCAEALTGDVRAAGTCPITDKEVEAAPSYMEAVVSHVRAAKDCPSAYRLAEACQFGSSGDNQLDEIVRSKCEPLFLPTASPAVKASYNKALKTCDRIAERNDGMMYMSFAAICRAGAARDFAARTRRR